MPHPLQPSRTRPSTSRARHSIVTIDGFMHVWWRVKLRYCGNSRNRWTSVAAWECGCGAGAGILDAALGLGMEEMQPGATRLRERHRRGVFWRVPAGCDYMCQLRQHGELCAILRSARDSEVNQGMFFERLVRAAAQGAAAIVEVAQAIVLAFGFRWRVSEHFPYPLFNLRIRQCWIPNRVLNGRRAISRARYR